MEQKRREIDILFFVPNVIGYVRLALLCAAFFFLNDGYTFLALYSVSAILDFFDGWAARAFNQRSSFGAWLDVILDNLSRGLLWNNVSRFGFFIISVEWMTFLSNYRAGGKWRDMDHVERSSLPTPAFVQKVMANGFKTPLGFIVISGLHVLPIWIYAAQQLPMENYIPVLVRYFVTAVLVSGRSLCLSVELWCIYKHIRELLREDIVESK